MPRVNGNYSLPPSYRATSGQTIRTEQHNPPLEDIAQALTDSLPRDGSAPMIGNLAMGGRRITNLRAGTASSDALRRDQVFSGSNAGKLAQFNSSGDGFEGKDPADFAPASIVPIVQQAAPPGAILFFPFHPAPDGWLKCNGRAVSRTIYADLFAAIGTSFGDGDGSTTFNLPDFRGEFLRGWDDGRGVDSGRALGSAQGDSFKSHNHDGVLQETSGKHRVTSNRGQGVSSVDATGSNVGDTTGDTGGSETRPRNIALLVAIKT